MDMDTAIPFAGDWREVAPTLAQVEAHAGHWWRWRLGSPPVADRLVSGEDPGDAGPFVWSDTDAARYTRWVDASEDWRAGCRVCPCDANGRPVAWP